jgi:hypothetical protein
MQDLNQIFPGVVEDGTTSDKSLTATTSKKVKGTI